MVESRLERAIRDEIRGRGLSGITEMEQKCGLAHKKVWRFLRGDNSRGWNDEVREKVRRWLGCDERWFVSAYRDHLRKEDRGAGGDGAAVFAV